MITGRIRITRRSLVYGKTRVSARYTGTIRHAASAWRRHHTTKPTTTNGAVIQPSIRNRALGRLNTPCSWSTPMPDGKIDRGTASLRYDQAAAGAKWISRDGIDPWVGPRSLS